MLAPSFARWLAWLRLPRIPCYKSIICSRRAVLVAPSLGVPSFIFICLYQKVKGKGSSLGRRKLASVHSPR